jgi:hypothetical protein
LHVRVCAWLHKEGHKVDKAQRSMILTIRVVARLFYLGHGKSHGHGTAASWCATYAQDLHLHSYMMNISFPNIPQPFLQCLSHPFHDHSVIIVVMVLFLFQFFPWYHHPQYHTL